MIALYIKTHRKTGLKYLGKTIQDPFEYQGSGRRWTRHIAKHGYDVDTEVVRWCVDNEAVKAWGIFYSDLFNVVDDPNWANLKREEGAGGWGHITEPYDRQKYPAALDSSRKKLEDVRRREVEDPEFAERIKRNRIIGMRRYFATNPGLFTDKNHSEETIKLMKSVFKEIDHQQGEKNSQFGSRWVSDGKFNMKLPSDVNTPVGWQEKRVMGLPSIDKELKELLIAVTRE